jgi:protein KRI1
MKKTEDVSWLFGEDGAKEELTKPTLVVNEKFATRFEQKNRDMHIARLEAEVEALDQSIESEDEEEDEVGELVTGDIAGEFLEVYSRIRERDPALYDAKTEFFKSEGNTELPSALVEAKEQARAARPDKSQKRALMEATILRGEEEEDKDLDEAKKAGLSIVEQDQELKKEFQKAFFEDDDDDKEEKNDNDDLLVEKAKSRDEEIRFEEEYKKFLDEKKREKIAAGAPAVRAFWAVDETAKAAQLSESEKFLRSYILENGWVDEEAATRRVDEAELDALSASEEELDRADEFEARLNFRHEEPGAAEGPVSYPRNLPSVRTAKPSTRQKARERTKESKKEERKRLAEELKRLKVRLVSWLFC